MGNDFFERLRERAVEIHVEDHLRSRLHNGDKLRVKLGLDPTAPGALSMIEAHGTATVVSSAGATLAGPLPAALSRMLDAVRAEMVAEGGATVPPPQ